MKAKKNTKEVVDAASILSSPLEVVKGVGPKLALMLRNMDMRTVEDLLYCMPNRYEDRRSLTKIVDLRPGVYEVFYGVVYKAGATKSKGGKDIYEAVVRDKTGFITFKWFHFSKQFMDKTWKQGKKAVFAGEINEFGRYKGVLHPDVEWISDNETLEDVMRKDPLNFGRILPVYPLTQGLHQKAMRKIMKQVVDDFSGYVGSYIPDYLRSRRGVMDLDVALRQVHFPPDDANIDEVNAGETPAHKTLIYDEFLFLELGLALRRKGIMKEQGIAFKVDHVYTKPLMKMLPYQLTNAQRRVLTEIKHDMMAPSPMYRLVQGDVGSGKTILAFCVALVAIENDYQVVLMAPTEILAEQHYLGMKDFCSHLGISCALLTSNMGAKEKRAVLASVASGETTFLIGTHAVIQEKVEFQRLGLGIIDEQHRFGVAQRGMLKKKGQNPDILVMTATPIPRTLSMTVYGDLAVSVIDELPPGRTPIETKMCFESQRGQVYDLVRREIAKGRQAYVIYPMVEETDKTDLKAASEMAEHLAKEVFPDMKIGLLHGRMKGEEKEAVMTAFKNNETDILVSTTVVEVGVNVPNSTVMVIEHAERFGLAQLHQLRGRVGRGTEKSYCVLFAGGKLTEDGEQRLQVMERTTNGFEIAEADLKIRGPGDIIGTRQSGIPDFRVASVLRDGNLLEEARKDAFEVVDRDAAMEKPEHGGLKEEIDRRWYGRLETVSVA